MIDEAKVRRICHIVSRFRLSYACAHARSVLWSNMYMDLLTLSTSSEMLHGLRRLMMMIATMLIVTAGYMAQSINRYPTRQRKCTCETYR